MARASSRCRPAALNSARLRHSPWFMAKALRWFFTWVRGPHQPAPVQQQVPQVPPRRVRHPDRREAATGENPRQVQGIAAVGLLPPRLHDPQPGRVPSQQSVPQLRQQLGELGRVTGGYDRHRHRLELWQKLLTWSPSCPTLCSRNNSPVPRSITAAC